jgi:hypothetical protein
MNLFLILLILRLAQIIRFRHLMRRLLNILSGEDISLWLALLTAEEPSLVSHLLDDKIEQ